MGFKLVGERWNPLSGGQSLAQFIGVIARAANIPHCANTTEYTLAMFLEDFPQFGKTVTDDSIDPPTVTVEPTIPATILESFIAMANAAILECVWGASWRYAMGLFVAHCAALYAQAYYPSSPDNDAGTGAGSGQATGVVTSGKLGDAAITYDAGATTGSTQDWGAWNATIYGQQLITMARPLTAAGMYAI